MRERFQLNASVFAVVLQKGKYLSVRRKSTGWLDGHWSLPAGAHDGGESFQLAAIRELYEETGLVVDQENCQLLHVQHVFMRDKEWIGFYFGVEKPHGHAQVREPEKHDRVEWRDLINDAEPVVPYVQEALKNISGNKNFSVFQHEE